LTYTAQKADVLLARVELLGRAEQVAQLVLTPADVLAAVLEVSERQAARVIARLLTRTRRQDENAHCAGRSSANVRCA
jgi:hypothetical protein